MVLVGYSYKGYCVVYLTLDNLFVTFFLKLFISLQRPLSLLTFVFYYTFVSSPIILALEI